MKQKLDGAVVLVTGGTGSLGQSLVRRLLRLENGSPSRIIVFSRDEAKQYSMKTAWKHAYAATDDIYYSNFEELLEFWIGDVRDADAEGTSGADRLRGEHAPGSLPDGGGALRERALVPRVCDPALQAADSKRW